MKGFSWFFSMSQPIFDAFAVDSLSTFTHMYIYIYIQWPCSSSSLVKHRCFFPNVPISIHHTAKHVAQFSHPPSILLARLEGYTPKKYSFFRGIYDNLYGWRTPFSDKNPLIDRSEVSIMANYGESLAADG